MPEDLYTGYAGRYDRQYARYGEHDASEVAFYRQLFEHYAVYSVLDCACGTGHDLCMFYEMGYEVIGSDASLSMLIQAHRNLKRRELQIPIFNLDYCELAAEIKRSFDAVVCLGSSILHMPDRQAYLRAFQSMYSVLYDKGILVLTQGITDKQWREQPRFIPMVQRRDFSRVIVIDYQGRAAAYHVLDLVHNRDECTMETWSTRYGMVALRDDYDALLREAGFDEVRFLGSFRGDPYSVATSDMMMVLAIKGEEA